MKDFLKENIAIVAAIVLPLVLVAIFIIATSVTAVTVEDPRYDFLLATNYNHSDSDAIRFDIVQNRLIATYRYPRKNEGGYYMYNSTPRLWRVHVDTMAVEEISLPLPDHSGDEVKPDTELNIPGLAGLKVSNIQPGPDGYRFEYSDRYYHGNIMTELFSYDGNYESGAALIKNGRAVTVKGLQDSDYRYNTHFIGWIIEENKE